MKSLDSGNYLDQSDRNCGLGIMFYLNLLSITVEFLFRLVILFNFSIIFVIFVLPIFGNYPSLRSLVSLKNQNQIR